MLRIDLRDLQRGPVPTTGQIAPGDPVLEGLDLVLDGPVDVGGHLQASGDDEYLWRGHIRADVVGECRRCLTEVRHTVDAGMDVLFSTDPDAADDPSVYLVSDTASHVDVAEVVREELALAAPKFLLCRDDCAGLCPRCGADLNAGPCACAVPAEPVRGTHGGT
jgi:uncharacterized protein